MIRDAYNSCDSLMALFVTDTTVLLVKKSGVVTSRGKEGGDDDRKLFTKAAC